ncbi:MAG TPA: hypothetical protein VNE21_02755, partial [Mycobacteriales bacterium]|nr:hypothetical protein [Mycobacteriales bacterium]
MPAPTNAPTTAPRRRGSHRRRWLAIAIVALVVVVGAWSVLTALAAKDRLSRVRTDLLALRAHPPATAALDARLAVDLREATAARALVHQFGPTLVSYLPLVGRTLAAERAVADASVGVLRAGRLLVTDTTGLSTGGRIDLARLAITEHDLRAAAAALDPSLRALADVHLGWTPGFVAREARLAQTRLDGSAVALRAAADLTDVVRGLLGGSGPRQILVALENNAELRGTGGL